MKINHYGVRTWIEVERSVLKHNLSQFRELIAPECKIMAVAKSNAYGHGLYDYSLAMDKLEVDWFAVDSVTEALTLRKKGIKKPILILGHTLPERLEEALSANISLTVSSFDALREIDRLNFKKKFKIHLKIDTGMRRQGFLPEEIDELTEILLKMENIEVEGIYTHFAEAKDPKDTEFTTLQTARFIEAFSKLEALGFKPIRHACATAGTLIYPSAHFDMVRLGIGLYGYFPSLNLKKQFEKRIDLRPALSWRATISEVKAIKKGERISYDLTEKMRRNGKIAIIPVGYWQGFPRSLSSKGKVLINGQYAKVLGRVTMDMIIVDISKIDCKTGSTATIIGSDLNKQITAYEIAETAGQNYYEFITRLNPLIKKIYT